MFASLATGIYPTDYATWLRILCVPEPALRTAGLALIVAGLATGVVALCALHALPTGLSPLRNAVSQYGISRYRGGYRVQTIGYGVAGLGAAVGLATLSERSSVVIVFCGVFAVARVAISWFPMDVPGGQSTASGQRHRLLAVCAFGALGLAALQLSRTLDDAHLRPSVAAASVVLAALMLVSFVAMGVERRTSGEYFGLVERGFYACMTAWLVLVAVVLATQR